jgi:hypothetical protein
MVHTILLTALLTILIPSQGSRSPVRDQELIGPPPFHQVTKFECVFVEEAASAGTSDAVAQAHTVTLEYHRVDHKRRTAAVVSGGRELEVTLIPGPESVSFAGMDLQVFQVATLRTELPRVAKTSGWSFEAVLSRHRVLGSALRIEQARGSCRADHPRVP